VSGQNVSFIQKPFAPSELVRKLRQLIDPEKKPAMASKAR